MFGTNSLSNTDIIYILKSQGVKLNGVFMKDELPSKLKTGFYVVNLQSSNIGNGTHWTAFYYNSKKSFYFDAFGFLAPIEIEKKLKKYKYNDKQIQNSNSTACGFYCVAFILFLNGKKNKELEMRFEKFVDAFSTNTKINDKLLYDYLYN
jgi:hypothetical protein